MKIIDSKVYLTYNPRGKMNPIVILELVSQKVGPPLVSLHVPSAFNRL